MADGSSKFKNSINLEPQSADPSNPAEGDTFCSDGTSRAAGYWQYINGAWSEFGGGGQGGINYLAGDNSDAENGIGDWVTYADAAGENAVDGTGGTALGVTLTQNTTSPLREDADFKFSKDAADRQGEGASVDFTIDNADKAQKLTISFDYDASSANYADDDIRIAIYDVTNANLIRVNGEDLKGGKGTHLAQFQTSADSTSYRLIIHQSSTNATAYDVYLDNISVGPREVVKGAAMTDWIDFTPTGTWTTNTTYTGKYRRVGDSAEIQVLIDTSGLPNAAILDIDISSIGTLDVNKLNDNVTLQTLIPFSQTTVLNTGTVKYTDSQIEYVDNVTVRPSFTAGTGSRSNITNTSPFSFASGDKIWMAFKVPIQGWSSNAVTSEDLGGRDVVVRGASNNGQVISANTEDIVFEIVEDTTNSWGSGNTVFTVPETGYYEMSGCVATNATNSASLRATIDGTLDKYVYFPSSSSQSRYKIFYGMFYLTKGQTLSLRTDTAITIEVSVNAHYIHIQKLASPQTILETETVAARYTSNSGQTITGIDDTLVCEDLSFDTHNAYNTSTGVYIAPTTGYYDIKAKWRYGSIPDQTIMYSGIRVDGSEVSSKLDAASRATSLNDSIQDIIYIEKGQEITIKAGHSTSPVGLSTNAVYTTFSIARIK